MSTASPTDARAAPPPTRPRLLDYALICVGVSLSAVLAEFAEVTASVSDTSPSLLIQVFLKTFAFQLFLPVGIILFWPVFFGTQRVFGRQQPLTMGEWLWGLSWLGCLFLVGYLAWKGLGDPPAFLGGADFKQKVVMGYVLGTAAIGTLAALLTLLSLLTIWKPQPWTHTFGLVLLMWPLVPLTGLWLLGIRLD